MGVVVEQQGSKVLSVKQGEEIVVRMKNEVGLLFEFSTLIADRGVNILAVSGAVQGDRCLVRLITSDNRRAMDVLVENNFVAQEEDVILVELPHRPNMLKQVTEILAKGGVDLRYVYAAATRDQDRCLLVFHSSDDEMALGKLKELEGE